MLQDLFLPITQTSGDDAALTAAIALAAAHRAHLSVVQPVDLPLPTTGPWGITPELVLAQVHGALREEATKKAARLRERLAGEDISWDVRIGSAPTDMRFTLLDAPRRPGAPRSRPIARRSRGAIRDGRTTG